jgi:redox-sensing transcriptional repressor
MNAISDKVVSRLSQYRRLLSQLNQQETRHVFSHQMADETGVTAAQVRRDLMILGFAGSPTKGYHVEDLKTKITQFLDGHERQLACICGIGNLGRAVLGYFSGRGVSVDVCAAFDVDPSKIGRAIVGRRCYHVDELETVCKQMKITVGIICTPADTAQMVAEKMIQANIRGILNFAPIVLKLPPDIYVQNMDVSLALETVAFFASQQSVK